MDFVKTSTGFAASGATAADVALDARGGWAQDWREGGGRHSHRGPGMDMVDAGANRIGASASVQIVRELGAPRRLIGHWTSASGVATR